MTPQRAVLLSLLGACFVILMAEGGLPDARRIVAVGLLYFVLSFMADMGLEVVVPFSFLVLATIFYANWERFFKTLGLTVGTPDGKEKRNG